MARLGKRERAEKRRLLAIAEGLQKPKVGRQSGGLVSPFGDYGKSCANVNPFNVQGKRPVAWEYNGRRTKHGKAISVK